MNPKLSLIIISYNTAALTLQCLKRVLIVFRKIKHEIIVIDNDSPDNSSSLIKKNFPQIKLLVNKKNLGFARAVNQGVKKARGEYILLLNTDALVDKRLLKALGFLDKNPKVALLSPRLIFPCGKLQANFGHYPSLFTEFLQATLLYKILPWGRVIMPNLSTRKRFYQIREVEWLSATCLFIKRKVFKKIGLFDEKFFMYLEDIDFCRRAKFAGFSTIFWGKEKIIHSHHGSSQNSLAPWFYERKSLLYFWKKYYPKKKIGFQIIKILSGMKLWGKILINQGLKIKMPASR